MSAIKRHSLRPAGPPIATAVEADGWLHVCGQAPRDADNQLVAGTMTVQAAAALDNMVRVLESAGYSTADVVKVNVWLDDEREIGEFNQVYARYFTPDNAPARVAIVSSMVMDCKLEVDCVAYRPAKKRD